MQLRFTSPEKRRKYLETTEALLDIIEPQKEYPFDFICYKITGYHPKGLPGEIITAKELTDDLHIFLWKLSGQVDDPADEQGQNVYPIDSLAKELNVSTKTISRWRSKGLLARKYTFDNGRKMLAVTQENLDKFLTANPNIAERAKSFTHMTPAEKQLVQDLLNELSADKNYTRQKAIDEIAKRLGRARETIRLMLADSEGPRKKIFKDYKRPLDPKANAEVFKLYQQGTKPKEIAKKFRRAVTSIYRIVRIKRVNIMLAKNIEFVPSDEFEHPDAYDTIIGQYLQQRHQLKDKAGQPDLSSGPLNKYLQSIKKLPRMTRDTELDLFRKYNYLKYLARQTQRKLHDDHENSELLCKIEKYYTEAQVINNRIIESNLQLVVSIAGKHTTTGASLQELISEGNFAMMRAVEKFDYSKGFRFATYASWIIAKNFARKLPQKGLDKRTAEPLENIQKNLRLAEEIDFGAIDRARNSLVQVIREELDEREQHVIIHHYGLTGSPIIKKTRTLKEIGDDLGLTGERIRQIELTALQKLKQSLSIDQFELLTTD